MNETNKVDTIAKSASLWQREWQNVERECKPNLLHANFAAFFRPLIDFSLFFFRALLHFLPLHNLIAVIFLKSTETLSNVKTTKNGSQTIRFDLLHGSFYRRENDMEVFPWRFSFFAVKYREIVVNITQVLINSNIFRCSQYGWHFAINNSSRTN